MTDNIGIVNGAAQDISDGRRSAGQSILDHELDARFAKMELSFRREQKTPWSVVWAAAGVCLVVLAGAYTLVIGPINWANEKTDARFLRIEMALTSLTVQTNQVAVVQGDVSRQLDRALAVSDQRLRDSATKDDLNQLIRELNARRPKK